VIAIVEAAAPAALGPLEYLPADRSVQLTAAARYRWPLASRISTIGGAPSAAASEAVVATLGAAIALVAVAVGPGFPWTGGGAPDRLPHAVTSKRTIDALICRR
jgi:hypothetical protein